jgi:hypothetical protein
MNFKRLDDIICVWPKVAEDDLVQLLETNVSGVLTEALPAHVQVKCNAIIYSCLCGSLLESVQEGKSEIRYQFRQHSVCSMWGVSLQSLGNLVTMYFFKVFEYQVGLSGMFDPPTLGLGGESVAQGCKNLPPVAI